MQRVSCNVNIIHKIEHQNTALCSECFSDRLSQDPGTLKITEQSGWLMEASKIWRSIVNIRNKLCSRAGTMLEPPFRGSRRITCMDRAFLESVVVIMVAFILSRNMDVPLPSLDDIIVTDAILRLIQYNMVIDAHVDFLDELSQTNRENPKFFTPVGLDRLGDHNHCPICYETFNDKQEAPICFPCNVRHIVCCRCGPNILKNTGPVCPLCRDVFNQIKYNFQGVLEAADPENWRREQNVVSPWWIAFLRNDVSP